MTYESKQNQCLCFALTYNILPLNRVILNLCSRTILGSDRSGDLVVVSKKHWALSDKVRKRDADHLLPLLI